MADDVYISFGGKQGQQVNINDLITEAHKAAVPTTGDLLYAGQRQRTRMLERTARGVDYMDASFTPYSTKGPFYYYPGRDAKNRLGAVQRFQKKLGLKGNARGNVNRVLRKRVSAGHLGEKKAWMQRTHLGIKFSSYAAFKAALGRGFVDLRGVSAPHMLQAIIIRVRDFIVGAETTVNPDPAGKDEAADTITLGIYGEEGARANSHNNGKNRMPRRRFLSASEGDKAAILNDIVTRVTFRIRRVFVIYRGS